MSHSTHDSGTSISMLLIDAITFLTFSIRFYQAASLSYSRKMLPYCTDLELLDLQVHSPIDRWFVLLFPSAWQAFLEKFRLIVFLLLSFSYNHLLYIILTWVIVIVNTKQNKKQESFISCQASISIKIMLQLCSKLSFGHDMRPIARLVIFACIFFSPYITHRIVNGKPADPSGC